MNAWCASHKTSENGIIELKKQAEEGQIPFEEAES
jgi:hypothetical protein